ncbi:chitin synthase-domain-containing protein [Mortierella sp. GBAus27b]|nr:chitin synthase-domain-containing protein [Mortierella sp. GBAus27b]
MPLQSDYTSSDLTHLGSTSDDAIVHNISSRWKQKLPYTRINASTLVAVNPFEVLPMLNDAYAEQYADWCYRDVGETVQVVHGSHHIAPHPYELAGRVYFHLRRTGQDQTIVMRQEYDNGISGSGKTVSTSHLLSQLCRLATHTKKEARIANKLQQAQQVLDAFGCCHTRENNNASMFSKFLEIQFNERGRILGGKTLCYLLNTSRVTRILPDERTFQVFYYLLHAGCSSLSDQEKSQLRLQETFAYINHAFGSNAPTITVSAGMGMDDSLGLEHLKGAMATCGFRPRQIQHIWRLIAAILHLGNLQFTDPVSTSKQSALQEAAIVRNPETLDFIADILGVPSDKLMLALTYKSKLIRRDLCTVVLNAQGSSSHRDSLARALYMALFGYIVEQINRLLCHSDPANFVAILDQPGLSEAPGSTSIHLAGFEQFSVNFANELLYGFMGRRMLDDSVGFNSLQVQDGIPLPGPMQQIYTNNTSENSNTYSRTQTQQQNPCSTVPGGLVRIMDDSSSLYSQGSATDADCLHKATLQLRGESQSQAIFTTNRASSNYFAIQHFTGKVEYSVDDFMEKNLDQISPDFIVLLRNSANKFIVDLFSTDSAGPISVERHPKFEKTIVKAQLQTRPKRQPSRHGGPIGSHLASRRSTCGSKISDTVLSQVFSTLHELIQTMDETTLWHMICLRPNDMQSSSAIDTKKLRTQVNTFLLPEISHRKRTEYTISYLFDEFLERYRKTKLISSLNLDRVAKTDKGQCMDVANAPGRGWNAPDGPIGPKFALGNMAVWLSEEVWKELEDELRVVEKEERQLEKKSLAAPTTQGRVLSRNLTGDMTLIDNADMDDGDYNRLGSAFSSTDRLLNLNLGKENGEGAFSEAEGPDEDLFTDSGEKDDDQLSDFGTATGPEPVEEVPTTFSRKLWVFFTWCMTWWIPSFMLSSCGKMKREDIRMAWREKVALCCIIFFMSAVIIFVITGFGKLMCPGAEHLFSPKEVGYHAAPDDFYISLRGKVYDITRFARNDHSNGHASYPSDTAYMLPFAGTDVTEYFPLQLNVACFGLVTSPSLSLVTNNTIIGAQVHGPPTSDTTIGWSSQNNQGQWYWRVALPRLLPMKKGELTFEMADIQADTNRKWFVLENGVYDLTSYYNTIHAPGNTGPQGAGVPSVRFLDKSVEDMVFNHNGEDTTAIWKKLPLDRQQRALTKSCLDQVFYLGKLDYRKSFQCQFTNYMLLSTSVVLVSVIAIKFLAALQLGSVRVPEEHDKFVIIQIPCYTEDEDSLRKTIDSITALRYDDKRKLLFIIADGMIIGSGNDLPTPRIVLNLLGADPSLDPEPLAFKSIGEGSKQLNMGKIYSGLYEYEGHVVPYIVVVKVGKPSERSRPGNRGKRDSQVILMKFLNKVHFDSPMCPLELEIYHQMKNVIGVNPSFYEYILQVDADTEVMPDALNRLVSCMINDGKIIGLCGETQLCNEENSWTTMIQVYEYYISHHLAKAFESLFGSVTCLPGCFCMYRVRTPVKSIPLIISSKVIEDYSDNQVDTLHKKNLLSLGEDRYLTTLMMKYFPQYKMTFTPDATCKTVAPDRWSVLLSQRRRWINSTIHNLAELMFLPEMCGFCCFSMRFVVFLDLFGTLTLPASVVYLVYLIVIVVTGMETLPKISLILLGAVYGLQALIFIIKRQWQHIGWMFIYILAIPLFSFFIPIYSFWHFDDFSWGNTRVVVGESGNAKKVVILGDDEERFDEKMIPMKKWSVYEQEMWEIGSVDSQESKITAMSNRSKASEATGRKAIGAVASGSPRSYHGSKSFTGYDEDMTRTSISSMSRPIANISMMARNHANPSMTGASHSTYSHQPSEYSTLTAAPIHQTPMAVYHPGQRLSMTSRGGSVVGVPMNPFLDGTTRSMIGGSQRGPGSVVGGPFDAGFQAHGRSGSTTSAGTHQPTLGSDQPTDEQLANEIQNVLATADLMNITKKQVREQLTKFFGVDLTARKDFIYEVIDRVLGNNT